MADDIFDPMVGIYAYDTGCVDSGVRDEVLRKRLADRIDAMPDDELRLRLSRWLRDEFLSDDRLADGYGWEDAMKFCQWIDSGDYRG